MPRSYGVDVSSFQDANMSKYASNGAKFAIVKVTEGTNYQNPKANQQVTNARQAGMQVMAYFYATFSGNSSLARLQAQYAVSFANSIRITKGSYIAVDWEEGNGNSVSGNAEYNTQAVLTAMNVIQSAGYKPLLYSGAAVLQNNINTGLILKNYPNCLWVASYATMGRIDQPDFGWFPSMPGVAIWQFTDNWKGLSVDGNISLIDLTEEKEDDEMSWHPEVDYNQIGAFKINNPKGADIYEDSTLTKVVGHRDYGTTWKISRAKNGAVEAGTNQWFSQADGLTKINPLAVNENYHTRCIITAGDAYTQNEPKPAKGVKFLPPKTTWNVMGRKGKYLLVGNQSDGLYVDANKCKIVL